MAVYAQVPSDPIKKRRKAAKQIVSQRSCPPDEYMFADMKKKKTGRKACAEPVQLADKRKTTKGFEANASIIAKRQGISVERARAILAAGARKATPAAKKANPALKKVRGTNKKSKKGM